MRSFAYHTVIILNASFGTANLLVWLFKDDNECFVLGIVNLILVFLLVRSYWNV